MGNCPKTNLGEKIISETCAVVNGECPNQHTCKNCPIAKGVIRRWAQMRDRIAPLEKQMKTIKQQIKLIKEEYDPPKERVYSVCIQVKSDDLEMIKHIFSEAGNAKA